VKTKDGDFPPTTAQHRVRGKGIVVKELKMK
jgi:hypothetical protein